MDKLYFFKLVYSKNLVKNWKYWQSHKAATAENEIDIEQNGNCAKI